MLIKTHNSALTHRQFGQSFNWEGLVLLIATFWFSSSLLIDFVLMPMMYTSGMMREPGFATGGYSIFWMFNRIELLSAATLLTGVFVMRSRRTAFDVIASGIRSRWAVITGFGLLTIALLYTYCLTPQMSALGLNLSGTPIETISPEMNGYHTAYWVLESLKLIGTGWLMRLCYRDVTASV